MTEQSPFYCNINALTPAERARHKQTGEQLDKAKLETKEMPEGYEFRLDPQVISLADVAQWVSDEQKCCPFFDFQIDLEREKGPVWLKLGGRDGVKQFIRAEFKITDAQ